jgi:adenosylmethionine-8-amino-7-oxononanoate aminotransferase
MHSLFSGILPQHFFVKSPSVAPMEEALADLEATLKQHSDVIAAMISLDYANIDTPF